MRKFETVFFALAVYALVEAGCIKREQVKTELPAKPAEDTRQEHPIQEVSLSVTPSAKTAATRTWGDYFFQRGDFRRSVAYLREEVKRDLHNFQKWRHLGSAYGQLDDFDDSIYCYRKSLELNPADLKSYYDLSLMLDTKGNFDEAEKMAEKGIHIDPKDAELHASLGNILADQEKDDRAMQEYETALKLKPDDPVTHFNKGSLHLKRREMNKAEDEYREVLKLSPGDMEAAENLASIYILENRLADAERLNLWVIKKAPKDEDTLENAYFNLGIIYDREQKIGPALDMYKLALQVAPWDAACYVNAAVLLERLKRPGEALAYWEKYSRLFPTNKRQAELKKRIEALRKIVGQDSAEN